MNDFVGNMLQNKF